MKWAAGGRGLVVIYVDKAMSYARRQIGDVSYPEAKFEPLTNDTNNKLTEGEADVAPICSPTGKWLYYSDLHSPTSHPRKFASRFI